MVTEEQRQEFLENRRTFERLNRTIVEGEQAREAIVVTSRNGKQREILVHALTELDIARAAHTAGLTLQDLLKKPGKKQEEVTDEKGLAKVQYVDEIVSLSIEGDESQRLTARELAINLSADERVRVFNRVMEISGLTAKASEDVEKFQPEPPGRPTGDASV